MENARNKVVFEVGTTNLEQLAKALFLGTFNPDEIKHEMYSTKVMNYREEILQTPSSPVPESSNKPLTQEPSLSLEANNTNKFVGHVSDEMLILADKEQEELATSSRAFMEEKRAELAELKERQQRLTSLYIAKDIEREEFVEEKARILSQKKTLQELLDKDEKHSPYAWLEPLRAWIKTAKILEKISEVGSPQEKKAVASKIFGSNLFLDSKKARGEPVDAWVLLMGSPSFSVSVG